MTNETPDETIERWSGMTAGDVFRELQQFSVEEHDQLSEAAEKRRKSWLQFSDTPYDKVIELLQYWEDADDRQRELYAELMQEKAGA